MIDQEIRSGGDLVLDHVSEDTDIGLVRDLMIDEGHAQDLMIDKGHAQGHVIDTGHVIKGTGGNLVRHHMTKDAERDLVLDLEIMISSSHVQTQMTVIKNRNSPVLDHPMKILRKRSILMRKKVSMKMEESLGQNHQSQTYKTRL